MSQLIFNKLRGWDVEMSSSSRAKCLVALVCNLREGIGEGL